MTSQSLFLQFRIFWRNFIANAQRTTAARWRLTFLNWRRRIPTGLASASSPPTARFTKPATRSRNSPSSPSPSRSFMESRSKTTVARRRSKKSGSSRRATCLIPSASIQAPAGPAETIVPDIPGYAQLAGGGHWTRDVVFTKDGQHMLVSVGSGSNVDDADTHQREFHRADVLEFTPEGKFVEVYAHGIRNCVGGAINPTTD